MSSVLRGTEAEPATEPYMRVIQLQPDAANAAAIYVGGSSAVASTDYGFRLEPATTGVPPAPWLLGDPMPSAVVRLSEIWVKGTNGEKLRIFAVVGV